jgi:hypothetical protein
MENELPPEPLPRGNRRQRQRSRGWCFTLNNHTEQDTNTLLDHAAVYDASYILQEERGENGTPHLQGFIHFKHQTAFSTLRSWNHRIHWERTADVTASVRYCSDPAKRAGRIWARGYSYTDRDLRLITENDMFDWQRELLQELRGEPDMRSVVWYCDVQGGCGKTAFCRWLVKNFPHVLFVSTGSAKDITYQVVKSTWDPAVVIFNLPRTAESGMSYSALESLKDGLLFSGKYEGGIKLFPPPHVIIFANFLPDETKLSADRWSIRTLLNNPPRLLVPQPMNVHRNRNN